LFRSTMLRDSCASSKMRRTSRPTAQQHDAVAGIGPSRRVLPHAPRQHRPQLIAGVDMTSAVKGDLGFVTWP
jgi:hypothetical protein